MGHTLLEWHSRHHCYVNTNTTEREKRVAKVVSLKEPYWTLAALTHRYVIDFLHFSLLFLHGRREGRAITERRASG